MLTACCRGTPLVCPLPLVGVRTFTRRRVSRRKRPEDTHYPADVLQPNSPWGTFVVRHVRPPPATPVRGWQRSVWERQDFSLYELIEMEDVPEEEDRLKVILTEYVEGIGNRGECVGVERDYGRNELLLAGRAVYASPANLAKFEKERERLAASGIVIKPVNKVTALFARELSKIVVPVTMSLENPWTIEPWHVRLSLRSQGYIVQESQMLLLPEEPVSGPDLKLHDSLFRAYMVLDNQLVCPLTCRIQHVSCDEAKQLVSGVDDPAQTSEHELRKCGLAAERVYVHHDDSLDSERVVRQALANRDQDMDRRFGIKKFTL